MAVQSVKELTVYKKGYDLTEITVPRLGWTMEEGTFVGWLKKDGELVSAGEPLFTLDGDKALQEIEATDSGILSIPPDAPKPGSTVRVGALLGYLTVENEKPTNPAVALTEKAQATPPVPKSASSSPAGLAEGPVERSVGRFERQSISPRAVRTATQLGVDWTHLHGTGRKGRIRERDVLAAAVQSGDGHRKTTAITQHAKVVVTDWTFPDLSIEEGILKSMGHDVIARQCKTEADLIALVGDADCVITQFARVNANVIAAMAKARVIVRYGIGVDNVDLDAARAQGIPVCHVPDYCIDEVADHTLAFILAATRQVVLHTNHVRGGQWSLAVPLDGMKTLRDLSIGVVGFGRIGREVVRRLAPFKCQVLIFDPVVPAAEVQRAGAKTVASLDELLPACDVLTLHCPSTAQTRKMIGTGALAKLKSGAILVNVARGDLVDTTALIEALESGHLAAAALDVCDPEPIPADHPLLKFPNVILAPHIASTSPTAVKKLRETAATLAATAARGELPPNVVNGVTAARPLSGGSP